MPYFPPSQSTFNIRSDDNLDGYITVSGDGYIFGSAVYIDIVNVSTTSSDWDLYLCLDNTFDIDDTSTVKVVSGGIGDTHVPVGFPYSTESGDVYFIYTDNNGSATCSLYISGRTL